MNKKKNNGETQSKKFWPVDGRPIETNTAGEKQEGKRGQLVAGGVISMSAFLVKPPWHELLTFARRSFIFPVHTATGQRSQSPARATGNVTPTGTGNPKESVKIGTSSFGVFLEGADFLNRRLGQGACTPVLDTPNSLC